MNEWIDRKAALAMLGVKAQTLYAYVSRGRIAMQADPEDPRRSLYRMEDIAGLATRRMRGRKPSAIAASSMAWGEPAIATGVSTVHHGKLYYRGQNAVELAYTATLEDVAALLWEVTTISVHFGAEGCTANDPFQALAALVGDCQAMLGRNSGRLTQDAQRVVSHLALSVGIAPSDMPFHERLARAWNLDQDGAMRARKALVLMADHDLNASTFATRVCASTGASMAASVLAGLCTLSGPRHGGASTALMALLEDAQRKGPEAAVTGWLDRNMSLPGFGHPLYPNGDPRAAMMLDGLSLDILMRDVRDCVFNLTGALPNCDFAMAALVRSAGFPPSAPFTLFMLGRSVGWCAHAIEQITTGELIRPRGLYDGVPLKPK